ncbi:uncharacterized protein L203_100322 [Cryptococcus depauperatus CBS 7841]|uniref:Phosphodiesterase n=1 Tax=Cryptococcus depauperatus CBS 7841 TaxID=1295531 RepID=A0A1E3IZ32_9TREE|nr:hypothetical protein L203_00015 [Cryptococcus depauperatus CBS 7841]
MTSVEPKPPRHKSKASDESNVGWGKYTELAELLNAMYYQTGATVEVHMEEYEELSAPLTQEHRSILVDALATWNFKPHDLPEGDLFRVACLVFETVLSIDGLTHLGLEQERINRLLFAIRAIYHAPNPYHNYVHAIDVLQATYTFLCDIGVVPPWSFMRTPSSERGVWKRDSFKQSSPSAGTRRAREVLRPQDVLAVMVAAMGHDVGHPGLSNAFMKNAKVPLSQVYEDKSVLENMHCMLIVQLLRKHGFGFLIEQWPSNPTLSGSVDHQGFRKVLYSSILATDMSLHFAWIQRLEEFDDRLDRGETGVAEEERILICQALIKCADISNPSRPIDVSQHWSSALLEEWAKQASLEQDLSLPVSVVASADAALQAKGQIGFIDLFTRPLFEAVSDAFLELRFYTDSCIANLAIWKARLEELTEKEGEEGQAARSIIQPAIEGASHDERFKTLFPLLLPTSLLAGLSSMSLDEAHMQSADGNLVPTHSPISPFAPLTPSIYSLRTDEVLDKPIPSTASVMHAVYHAKLVDQTAKSKLTNWSKGVSQGETRRMSTPEVSTGRRDI